MVQNPTEAIPKVSKHDCSANRHTGDPSLVPQFQSKCACACIHLQALLLAFPNCTGHWDSQQSDWCVLTTGSNDDIVSTLFFVTERKERKATAQTTKKTHKSSNRVGENLLLWLLWVSRPWDG
jgi:hypothetical protein